MFLLDTNILIAAHRNDHPDHQPVRNWFDELLKSDEQFTVPAFIWASFLRITTNRRIFEVPTPRAKAFAFIEATCAQAHYIPTGPGPRHLVLLKELCDEADAVGDLMVDAVIAAIALEHGCEVATLDRDFARFSSVHHYRPADV